MVIEDWVAQFPEGCAGTVATVLYVCFIVAFWNRRLPKHGKLSTTYRVVPDSLMSGCPSMLPGGGDLGFSNVDGES